MKIILRHILASYLGLLARILLTYRRPLIIAVAGTVNKGFAVTAIAEELRHRGYSVETPPHNFNTEIGLPLAILGLPSGYDSYRAWKRIIWRALWALKRPLAGVFVLELGIYRPGDMKALLAIIKPRIAIVTDITQRYRENFGGLDRLVAEYRLLLSSVANDGLAVLNYDTIVVRELASSATCPVSYVSLSSGTDNEVATALIEKLSSGQRVKFSIDGEVSEEVIDRFGRHHALVRLIGRRVGAAPFFQKR